jgi:hypothetical protein
MDFMEVDDDDDDDDIMGAISSLSRCQQQLY